MPDHDIAYTQLTQDYTYAKDRWDDDPIHGWTYANPEADVTTPIVLMHRAEDGTWVPASTKAVPILIDEPQE